MKPLLLTTLALLALLMPAPLMATTIYVDCNSPNDPGSGTSGDPFRHIQDGIDAAVGGDTVLVRDGIYTGTGNKDLDYGGKAIMLRSVNGSDVTIIDCEGSGRGFHFCSGETQESVVDGFTVTNGFAVGDGGGIFCQGSTPTILNCTIANNAAGGGGGEGEEEVNGWGGGIAYDGYSTSGTLTIANCRITANTASDCGGIGCVLVSGHATVSNCTIVGNSAVGGDYPEIGGAGGFGCVSDGELPGTGVATLANCVIAGNDAKFGGGIACCVNPDNLVVINCTIFDNHCRATGGGAWNSGGGIWCVGTTLTITNCVFWENTAPDGHEIGLCEASALTVGYCDVQGGAAEAYVEPGCTLDMDASNIDENPLFVSSGGYDYFLSQTAAGQGADSPCLDAGSDTAANLGLAELTTRTDRAPDSGTADMGCHLPYEFWITDVYWDQATTSVVVTFNSIVGVDYVVESAEADACADSLGWSDLTPVTAAGPTTTVTDDLSSSPLGSNYRFYRVRWADSSEWGQETVAVFRLNLAVSFALRQFFVSTPLEPDPDHTGVQDVLGTQLDYAGAKLDKLTADTGLYTRATYDDVGKVWNNSFPIAAGEAYWLNVGNAYPIPHTVRLTGYVPEKPLTVSVTRASFAVSRRWMAYSMPRSTTLGALGLETAITPFWAPTNEVRLLPLGTTVWKRYFFDGTNWREGSIGGTLADTTPIACGEGILFIHQGIPGQANTLTWPTWYIHPPNVW